MEHGHKLIDVFPQQRLPARQPDFPDAKGYKKSRKARDFFKCHEFGPVHKTIFLAVIGRHAVRATEIAAVRYRNSQIQKRPVQHIGQHVLHHLRFKFCFPVRNGHLPNVCRRPAAILNAKVPLPIVRHTHCSWFVIHREPGHLPGGTPLSSIPGFHILIAAGFRASCRATACFSTSFFGSCCNTFPFLYKMTLSQSRSASAILWVTSKTTP